MFVADVMAASPELAYSFIAIIQERVMPEAVAMWPIMQSLERKKDVISFPFCGLEIGIPRAIIAKPRKYQVTGAC